MAWWKPIDWFKPSPPAKPSEQYTAPIGPRQPTFDNPSTQLPSTAIPSGGTPSTGYSSPIGPTQPSPSNNYQTQLPSTSLGGGGGQTQQTQNQSSQTLGLLTGSSSSQTAISSVNPASSVSSGQPNNFKQQFNALRFSFDDGFGTGVKTTLKTAGTYLNRINPSTIFVNEVRKRGEQQAEQGKVKYITTPTGTQTAETMFSAFSNVELESFPAGAGIKKLKSNLNKDVTVTATNTYNEIISQEKPIAEKKIEDARVDIESMINDGTITLAEGDKMFKRYSGEVENEFNKIVETKARPRIDEAINEAQNVLVRAGKSAQISEAIVRAPVDLGVGMMFGGLGTLSKGGSLIGEALGIGFGVGAVSSASKSLITGDYTSLASLGIGVTSFGVGGYLGSKSATLLTGRKPESYLFSRRVTSRDKISDLTLSALEVNKKIFSPEGELEGASFQATIRQGQRKGFAESRIEQFFNFGGKEIIISKPRQFNLFGEVIKAGDDKFIFASATSKSNQGLRNIFGGIVKSKQIDATNLTPKEKRLILSYQRKINAPILNLEGLNFFSSVGRKAGTLNPSKNIFRPSPQSARRNIYSESVSKSRDVSPFDLIYSKNGKEIVYTIPSGKQTLSVTKTKGSRAVTTGLTGKPEYIRTEKTGGNEITFSLIKDEPRTSSSSYATAQQQATANKQISSIAGSISAPSRARTIPVTKTKQAPSLFSSQSLQTKQENKSFGIVSGFNSQSLTRQGRRVREQQTRNRTSTGGILLGFGFGGSSQQGFETERTFTGGIIGVSPSPSQVPRQAQNQRMKMRNTSLNNHTFEGFGFAPLRSKLNRQPFKPKRAKDYEDEGDTGLATGFLTFVKRAGTFLQVGKPQSRQKAINLGARITDTTLSRTFKVIPTRTKVKREKVIPVNLYKFRTFSQKRGQQARLTNTFIERSRYSLENVEARLLRTSKRRRR